MMGWLRWYFLMFAFMSTVSFVIYALSESDKWFSRMCLSFACIAVYAILRELKNIREGKKED